MASLEVGIGANASDFDKELLKVEKKIQRLETQKAIDVKLGLDVSKLDTNIDKAKTRLEGLKKVVDTTTRSFEQTQKPVANAGNTLTQFSRIAQDAPFGIVGIGNNLTATAEAFSHLSKQSGGAGNALKAVASSLMSGGGILLAISLVTTGLTIMAQKGITVSDVFNKLTGTFDEFKKSLSDVNAESAKTSGGQVATAKAYVNAAQDINLSMSDRLIAVKKLQDEYPAYFGNLSKEQILNGNVSMAVKELTSALIAKAKAQGFANKVGEIAEKQVPLREKETELIAKGNAKIKERNDLLKQIDKDKTNQSLIDRWVRAGRAVESFKNELDDVQKELRANNLETAKWESQLNKTVEAGIKLDFKPERVKKAAKALQEQISQIGLKPLGLGSLIQPDKFDIAAELNKQFSSVRFDPLASINERFDKSREQFIRKLKGMVTDTQSILFSWNDVMSSALSDIGNSIGNALANGGNVLESIGASLLSSIGSLLSQLGDKLILLGTTAVLAGTVLATIFTPVGIAAGLAAIAAGVALKAGGGLASGLSQNMTGGKQGNNVSAGNSVSSPTSSVSGGSSFNSGNQTVVFEISGQSLVGVLSNTLNRNTKLGGTIAI